MVYAPCLKIIFSSSPNYRNSYNYFSNEYFSKILRLHPSRVAKLLLIVVQNNANCWFFVEILKWLPYCWQINHIIQNNTEGSKTR